MKNSAKAMPLSAGKLQTQAHACRDIWAQVVSAVFAEGKVADRTMAALLRSHREFGSRDRRFISETVFGFFRFWGWLRMLAPEAAAELEKDGKIAFSSLDVSRLLLGAALLSFRPGDLPEAASVWAGHLRIRIPEFYDYAEIGKMLKAPPFWGDSSELLPGWVDGYLSPDLNRERFYTALLSRPPLWLRCQNGDCAGVRAELAAAGVATEAHHRRPEALMASDAKVNLYTLEAFRRGDFEVQDLASQQIGLAASPRPGERWWDCCAGAGGKSLQLAALMNRKGTVAATDVRGYKLDDLRRRARRAGFPNIVTREWDGKKTRPQDRGKFDGVLVDAPCSCSGTWRRNPDGRWLLREEELPELAGLQLDILTAAAPGVKPGGLLIYATCSVFAPENEGVVGKFLASRPDFALEPFLNPLSGAPTAGMLLADPLANNSDSMFVARMRRKVE